MTTPPPHFNGLTLPLTKSLALLFYIIVFLPMAGGGGGGGKEVAGKKKKKNIYKVEMLKENK